MVIVNMHEAKTHLSKLVARAMGGEEIIIAKADKPVAVLSAFDKNIKEREPGNDKNIVIIESNFDDDLEEFDQV